MHMKSRGKGRTGLKRKAFFVDERVLRRAMKATGSSTEAEVVRAALERVVEMEEFWRFMKESRGVLPRGSFSEP